MKYTNIRQLPYRFRLFVLSLYMIGLGLVVAATAISILSNFPAGYMAGYVVEFALLAHLMKRAG